MALVTGATSGIGKEVARDLANRYGGIDFGVSCFDFQNQKDSRYKRSAMLSTFWILFPLASFFNLKIESILTVFFVRYVCIINETLSNKFHPYSILSM